MNKNAVPQIKRPMKPDAKAFNLALKDFAKLRQYLSVKIKYPDSARTNEIVLYEFFRRIKTFVCDEGVKEIAGNFSEIYSRFIDRPNGFLDDESVILKQGFLSMECLLHGEWWDKVMNFQYELAKQKNLSTAVNHCQQVMKHSAIAQSSFQSRPSDFYANFLACKVAYGIEHVPENMTENLVNFQILKRILNEYDNKDVFMPFYQKAESMNMLIENGLSPNITRGTPKTGFVM